MAQDQVRNDPGNADHVQDVGVRGVPRQADGSLLYESRGRRLSLRAVLIHDNHIQSRPGKKKAGCPICRQGLEGALAAPEEVRAPVVESEVVPGDRGDEAGTAAPAPTNRTLPLKSPMLRSGGN